jgi:hypothetical protein
MEGAILTILMTSFSVNVALKYGILLIRRLARRSLSYRGCLQGVMPERPRSA